MSQQPPKIPTLWKDPYDDKDYGVDLAIPLSPFAPADAPWLLPGEFVTNLSVTSSDAALIINSFNIATNASGALASLVIAWISGGVLDGLYTVRFFFTTSQGRKAVRSIYVQMVQS
jgi:hypothetical protein